MALTRVLWVEDNSYGDCRELAAPVYISGRYDLSLAADASEAEARLRTTFFEKVVVDIRLPPGEVQEWIQIFQKRGGTREEAKLGLVLLKRILKRNPIKTMNSAQFGVLSVEPRTEMAVELSPLGIRAYREKSTALQPRALLELLDSINPQGLQYE